MTIETHRQFLESQKSEQPKPFDAGGWRMKKQFSGMPTFVNIIDDPFHSGLSICEVTIAIPCDPQQRDDVQAMVQRNRMVTVESETQE